MLESHSRAFLTGFAALGVTLLLVVLLGWMQPGDVVMLLARTAHVLSAMIWVGLIWFVNVVQLAVLKQADDAGRAAVMTWIVPRVAGEFRTAANITVISGAILMLAMGYLTQRPLEGAALWLWAGALGGTAMLGFVHAKIGPALAILLDPVIKNAEAKAQARDTVRRYARINLLLSLPVTFAMLAASHG